MRNGSVRNDKVSRQGSYILLESIAVVEVGHPAIIVAVDQFITVTINQAIGTKGSIQSEQYSGLPIRWFRRKGELVLDHRENPFHYILAAIRLTEKYAKEKGHHLSFMI